MRLYLHLAELLNYPEKDLGETIDILADELGKYRTIDPNEFRAVSDHFTRTPLTGLQEYYVRTFDVNASCYLDVGYVLFGEESKRAQFLLHMKNEQLTANNDCGSELPDHLPNMLTLLPRIKDHMFREELIITMLLPALKHMTDNFRTDTNIYRIILKILIDILESDYRDSEFEPYRITLKKTDCTGIYAGGMDHTKLTERKF